MVVEEREHTVWQIQAFVNTTHFLSDLYKTLKIIDQRENTDTSILLQRQQNI